MTDLLKRDRGDAQENYDVMLEQIDDVIDDLSAKIEDGRIRDAETEKVRIKQYRTLAYLIRTKRKILQDRTLEELEQQVAELREQQENDTVLGGGR